MFQGRFPGVSPPFGEHVALVEATFPLFFVMKGDGNHGPFIERIPVKYGAFRSHGLANVDAQIGETPIFHPVDQCRLHSPGAILKPGPLESPI